MPTSVVSVSGGAELVVLERERLRVEIVLRPFALTIRRSGRRLLRSGGVWVADGAIHDHFVQFTEGVLAHEELALLSAQCAPRSPSAVPTACSWRSSSRAGARRCCG